MGAHVPFNQEELVFLNNFYTRFQLGTEPHPQKYPEGLHRFTMKACGWEKTKRASLKESVGSGFHDEVDLLDYYQAHSDKYLDQTPAEFYVEVDTVMTELGISAEEIARYLNIKVHEQQTRPPGRSGPFVDDLNLPLRPIYQALRERGYNKKDLWG